MPKGSLTLEQAFGFRCFYILDETRNCCKFTEDGKVAFVTAALGVVMDPASRQQSFFQKHEEDIVSFAIHPSRKIAATG